MEMIYKIAAKHSAWSQRTFGTDKEIGPAKAIKHLKIQCDDLLDSPDDIIEYADAFLLVIDAARRAGYDIDMLMCAALGKQSINEITPRHKPKPVSYKKYGYEPHKDEWPWPDFTPEDYKESDEAVKRIIKRETPPPLPEDVDSWISFKPPDWWIRLTSTKPTKSEIKKLRKAFNKGRKRQ